jgi:PAS domain-containing protein
LHRPEEVPFLILFDVMYGAQSDSTMELGPVPFAILDAQYRFVRVNRAMAQVHGKTADAHIGKTFDEVVPNLR